jgi:biotin operon repressor
VTPVKSPIGAALEQLQLERDNLVARLAKVDDLIVRMRDVIHLPADRSGVRAPVNGNGHGEISTDAIRAALQSGPMKPGDLAKQVGVTRAALRYHVQQLETQGVLVATGTTASRRIALAGKSKPAKEAP